MTRIWRFRRLGLLALAGLMLMPAACAAVDALERMDQANYERRCTGFGFRQGTDAFATCMMQQSAQDEEQGQRALDRAERRERWDDWRRRR